MTSLKNEIVLIDDQSDIGGGDIAHQLKGGSGGGGGV